MANPPVDVTEEPVIGVEWDAFLEQFRRRWAPGEHVAFIGPTGVGKTNVAGLVLPACRKYVVATDPKGGDTTLSILERLGFVRIDRWPPPRRVFEDIADGKPARLIVGLPIRNEGDEKKNRELLRRAIVGVFELGGFTLYIDELQIATDLRMMNLRREIERNLIAARDRKVSVVSSYQKPANVPRTAADQATYLFVWNTRDDDVVKRIAEMMGRPKPEVRAAMRMLPKHFILFVSRDPYEPMILTNPPKL